MGPVNHFPKKPGKEDEGGEGRPGKWGKRKHEQRMRQSGQTRDKGRLVLFKGTAVSALKCRFYLFDPCFFVKCRFGSLSAGFGDLGAGFSEKSRRLWLFPGSVRGFSRKTPGKSRENRWKMFPETWSATNSRLSGTGKGKPAGNLWSTLPGPCPHLPCGIDSSSLLEFFWKTLFLPRFGQWEPKGPRHTKNTMRSKFATRSEFTIALWYTIAAYLVRTPFSC